MHPRQREGQESRERLCVERFVLTAEHWGKHRAVYRRPETKVYSTDKTVLVKRGLTRKGLLHRYSMTLPNEVYRRSNKLHVA